MGGTDDIAALENDGDGLSLDGGGVDVAHFLDAEGEGIAQAERGESRIHFWNIDGQLRFEISGPRMIEGFVDHGPLALAARAIAAAGGAVGTWLGTRVEAAVAAWAAGAVLGVAALTAGAAILVIGALVGAIAPWARLIVGVGVAVRAGDASAGWDVAWLTAIESGIRTWGGLVGLGW